MRILFINSVYDYGSTGHIIANLMGVLKEHGNEVKVAFGRHVERADKNSIIIGNRFDVLLSVIGSRLFDNHGLMNKRATRKFIKLIDAQDFDVIHIHNLHGYYINYPMLFEYLSKKKTPVVWTLHDEWSMTGHAAYEDGLVDDRSKEQEKENLHKYPACFLFSMAKRNIQMKKRYMSMLSDCTIVTPSNWLMNEVKESYLNEYKQQVINNGIDLSVFRVKPTVNKSKDSDRTILGVSNVWETRKGLDDFIKLRKLLDKKYTIVLIGLDKKQISKLPDGITGFERTDSVEQLVDWYNRADIFLNLTYEDNYPTTNLEAIACGTKVITYNTGGSPESVSKGNGSVVEPGDMKALVRAIYNTDGGAPEVDIIIGKNRMVSEYEQLFKRITEI